MLFDDLPLRHALSELIAALFCLTDLNLAPDQVRETRLKTCYFQIAELSSLKLVVP
jgi:hypothetical protein